MRERRSVLEVVQPEDGGSVEHVVALARRLPEHGFDVEVAASPGNVAIPVFESLGIRVHRIPMQREPGPADLIAARRLRRLDRERRYDLVHAHSSKAGALVRAFLSRRRRLVYTPHCFAFAAGFSGPRRLLYRAVEQALVPRSGAIVTVSRWEHEVGRSQLAGAQRALRLIVNGVAGAAPAEPDPALRAFAGDEPLAGFIARLSPPKDPVLAVRAMSEVSVPGRLAIVGNGELGDAAAAEIDRLGLGDRVRLFPFEPPGMSYLAALDVVLLVSDWESLPIGVLDAMHRGLPVVGTAVGGVPEAVADGRTGLLVPPRDPGRLAAAIQELFADPARRRELGAAARAEAEERFGVDRMVAETAALYRELLGWPGAPEQPR